MKIFLFYLKDRSLWFIFLLISFLILTLLCFLYHIDLEIFFYGSVLCSFFLCLLIGLDLIQYKKRHDQRKNIHAQTIEQVLSLQDPTLSGIDYHQLLEKMQRAREDTIYQNEERIKEDMDYFTLWIHQVKLPISAMQLLLEEDTISKEQLKSQLVRINQYTDMVLAYLRMHSPQSDFVFRKVNLDDAIRQSIRYFSNDFITRKIHLSFKETHLYVLSDEKWLVFVIEQILSNALKYTSMEGTIQIYVEGQSALVIEDNGIGIQASDLARVFEKGYTGFNGRADKKASGLGLYLCKEICHKLSHKISIVSKPRAYTKVYLVFEQSYKNVSLQHKS